MGAPLVKCRQHAAILQLSSTSAAAYSFITSAVQILTSTSPVIGVDIWDLHALLWSTINAELFEISDTGCCMRSSLPSLGSKCFALHRSYIFRAQGLAIEVFDLQGKLKHNVELDEPLGQVTALDICEDFLVVATTNGFLQMWKFEDEFKNTWLPGFGRKICFLSNGVHHVDSLKCNYNGSKVSFLAEREQDLGLEPVLYIYDTVLDKFCVQDFRLEKKVFVNYCWDSEEFQNFACEFRSADKIDGRSEIVTFFVDSNLCIVEKDKIDIKYEQEGLVGKCEPYAYLYEGLCKDELRTPVIKKISIGILAGMEHLDGRLRQNLINFSNYVLTGRSIEAFKVLESIKDGRILKKVAKYCTKHGFQDSALLCFANMGRAYAVSTISNLSDELLNIQNNETKAAAVAIQLGCVADAEELYLKCKRYDLLISLYQTCGLWEKSIEVALKSDHVNLKNVHHAYAKHLEAVGDIQMAIHHYELSNTHRFEVPRMLFSIGKVDDLKKYVDEKKDPSLHRWWANYCEAKNMLYHAIDHYKLADEVASVVRVHCFLGDLDTAENIVAETLDPSATFHLGQQGTKKTMLSSAKYFEEKGSCEEAVLLYQKGGDIEKAVDICVHYQLFDALRAIADNLNEETDPFLLARCGESLVLHKQFEKATLLLVAAGQHRRAFELCTHEGVQITDKMMDLFSKQLSEEKLEDSKQLLTTLAEFCETQGSFHLACRTYTQAGDKMKAMKALMKSGDTEKILTYANVSRQKHLYVLAASYLQTLNWHNDANIMKKIVQMYTKAGEMELLASFYEACAQVEIDGYRDYEKALGAMKEAWKFLSKVQSPRRNGKMQSLRSRIEEVERFVQARRLAKSDPNGMISACTTLLAELSLQDRNGQAALRIGDLYALLIEFYYKEGNMNLAYQTIQTMNTFKLPVGAYVDQNILKSVFQANGVHVDEENGKENN